MARVVTACRTVLALTAALCSMPDGARATGVQAPAQSSGRQIQAVDGDTVVVENDNRIAVVRRRTARVRVVADEGQKTLILLADWAPPGSTEPDGRVNRTWRFTGVEGRWPLDMPWEGLVTMWLSDGPSMGSGPAMGAAPALTLETPAGTVAFVSGPPRPDPPGVDLALRFGGMSGGGREGASFDQAEQEALSPTFMQSFVTTSINGPGGGFVAGGAGIGATSSLGSAAGMAPMQWTAATRSTARPSGMPRVVHRVEAEWPQAARDAGVSGVVVLQVAVASDGTVQGRAGAAQHRDAGCGGRRGRAPMALRSGGSRRPARPADHERPRDDPRPTALSALLAVAAVLLQVITTGTIRGTVVEARTGQPLAAVLVRVEATGQQAISDEEGRFEIADVPGRPHTLLVSVVGYGLARREVTVRAGETSEVTLAIAEGASTYVESIVVGAPAFRDAEPGVSAQSTLGSRDLLALRGVVADDPFRAVQALPEVATGDDFRAEFAVRGLGPGHTGIAIDGVDTPLLFHTVRGVNDAGSLALINTDVLDSATLLAGAYPQRAGPHLGARLDFTTRDGARDRVRGRALFGVSATTGVFEGPLGRTSSDGDSQVPAARGSWLIALRKSYLGWLLQQLDADIDGAFGFTDGQATLAWDLSPAQSVRVTVVAGRSTWTENDPAPGPNTLDRATNRSVLTNLQWRYAASPRVLLRQQAYLVDAKYRNTVLEGRPREEGGDRDLTWRGSMTASRGEHHALEVGGQAQWLSGRRLERSYAGSSEVTTLDTRDSWGGGGAWAHYRWSPASRLELAPGLRADWSGLTRGRGVSPYVLAQWQVSPRWRLRGSAGQQHQFATFDQAVGVGLQDPVSLDPERAWTADGGLSFLPRDTWRLSVDGYYREERDRLRFEDSEFRRAGAIIVRPSNPVWHNALTGTAAGAVVTLERRQVNGLSGWLSFAMGRTALTDTLTSEGFVSDYDQARTLNAYGIYRTSRRLSFSARYRYGSNFPLAGYYQQVADEVWTLAEERNRARLPPYGRLDLRADWAFTYRRSRLTLFTELVNTAGRDNLGPDAPTIHLPIGTVTGLTQTLFPFLPSAGILIEF